MSAQESVPNHLVKAILVTIFCCLPLGIVAIVFAAQVNGKAAAGDLAGAMEASENANKWSNIGLGIGIVLGVIWFGLMMMGMLSGAAGSM